MSEAIAPRRLNDAAAMPRARYIGGGLLAVILVFGLLGPLLTVDPQTQNLRAILLPPGSAEAWLGTDHLGRSLLARLAQATRLSLFLGLAAVVSAALPGGS